MILVSFRTQSLHWRVSLARELSQYSFRVSRVLVKRVQLSQAPVVQKVDNAIHRTNPRGQISIHWITQLVSLILIHSIVICPMNNAIHLLNNRGQDFLHS